MTLKLQYSSGPLKEELNICSALMEPIQQVLGNWKSRVNKAMNNMPSSVGLRILHLVQGYTIHLDTYFGITTPAPASTIHTATPFQSTQKGLHN